MTDNKNIFTNNKKSDTQNVKDNLLIALINRNGRIIIPSGSDSIKVGDSVVVVTKHTGFNDIKDVLK